MKRILFSIILFVVSESIIAQNINLKIHLSGVYSSKISLLPLSGAGALKPMIEHPGIKNGETATLSMLRLCFTMP